MQYWLLDKHAEPEIISKDQIRLVDGKSYTSGRIQIYHNNIWGTICDDHFTRTKANVVCRQLGFLHANKYGHLFGPGVGPIWLGNVYCTGDESSISDCRHLGWGTHNCGHNEDVGVYCHDGKISTNIITFLKLLKFLLLKNGYLNL